MDGGSGSVAGTPARNHSRGARRWRTRDVWAISLSAFFSDAGYQAVWAGFPLFLVLVLHEPVWEFGLASAIAYGGGTVFAWLGARLGDRIGHRRVAIGGNVLIPLLSLSALWANPSVAIGLLCAGWWARNLRTPSRRVMVVQAAPRDEDRTAVFGFLHALDIGGGALAGAYVLIAVVEHVAFRWIFLGSALPLAAATLSLTRTSTALGAPPGPRPRPAESNPGSPGHEPGGATAPPRRVPGAVPLLVGSALFGFTSYSVGFPILTTAQRGGSFDVGIGAFLLFNVVSAATGSIVGPRLPTGTARRFGSLGALGYLAAVVGAALLAVGAAAHLTVVVPMVGVAALGFSLGVVTTVEPSLMSTLRPGQQAGRGFGALGATRGMGLFVGNLLMGVLYGLGPGWAYGYAAVMGLAAMLVVLGAAPLPPGEPTGRGAAPATSHPDGRRADIPRGCAGLRSRTAPFCWTPATGATTLDRGWSRCDRAPAGGGGHVDARR